MRVLLFVGMVPLLGGVWCALIALSTVAAGQETKKAAMPTLEEAYRKWDTGLSSDKREERVNTLRSMFPTKKELGYLFPRQVDKLWPKFEEGHKFMEENIEPIAKEITKGGAITKVKSIDARTDKNRALGSHKALLAILPKDVHVYDLVVYREKSTSGSGTYLNIKDRWFWIKDLDGFPAILEKLK